MIEAIDQQLRDAGFTSAAREFPRDRLLCAFNGVRPDQAPPGWWYHPNESSKAAWQRVADEVIKLHASMSEGAVGHPDDVELYKVLK